MGFPMFHLDWLNDRFLIAAIAILHVFINHGLAVGFIPYITWLEQKGVKNAPSNQITDLKWDNLIYQKMKVAFIITTTIGAMTGVGIWFSVALVSPASIGSLIRVFYWAWFTELCAPLIFGPVRFRIFNFLVIIGKRIGCIPAAVHCPAFRAAFQHCSPVSTPQPLVVLLSI
jgi:hypothetical protein